MNSISMVVRNPLGGTFRQVIKPDSSQCHRDPWQVAYDLYGEDLVSVNKPVESLQDSKNSSTFVSKDDGIANPKRRKTAVTNFNRKNLKKK